LDRRLSLSGRRAGFSYPRVCKSASWHWEREIHTSELIEGAREVATSPAMDLFELFGWDADPRTLQSIQEELRR
jgi:hypothetical protein